MRRLALAALACGIATPALAQEKNDSRCDLYGPGFVYVESIGSCVKIGGQFRADYSTGDSKAVRRDRKGFGGQARAVLDVRTDLGFAPFRAVIEPKVER